LAEVMRAHADELAEIETRDNGRIIVETTLFDLPACTEMLFYFAGAADKISGDTVQIGPNSFNFTVREPIGVVGLIVPWNAPLSIAVASSAPRSQPATPW
jgi:aldehyde dehydrogenase (NAD+)